MPSRVVMPRFPQPTTRRCTCSQARSRVFPPKAASRQPAGAGCNGSSVGCGGEKPQALQRAKWPSSDPSASCSSPKIPRRQYMKESEKVAKRKFRLRLQRKHGSAAQPHRSNNEDYSGAGGCPLSAAPRPADRRFRAAANAEPPPGAARLCVILASAAPGAAPGAVSAAPQSDPHPPLDRVFSQSREGFAIFAANAAVSRPQQPRHRSLDTEHTFLVFSAFLALIPRSKQQVCHTTSLQ